MKMLEDKSEGARTPETRMRLSIVIPVYNEERGIQRCLEAIRWADEVIIVDMFSTDRTQEICRSYPNVRFFQNRDYIFANVNYGIDRATGDWIMRLDADEIISEELHQEIDAILRTPDGPYSGYWIPGRTYFFGKWIRYGITYETRFGNQNPGCGYRRMLFRPGAARYPCQREHEDLDVTGEWGVLKGHYDHFSHRSVSHYISKMQYYTDRDVERMDVLAPDFKVPNPYKTPIALIVIFLTHFVRRKGYKDGLYGFITCGVTAMYEFVLRCKIWEKHYRLTHKDEIVEY